MNKFEKLAEFLSEELGPSYDIKFYENESKTWEEILLDTETQVHGVITINGGDSTKLGGILVNTDNVMVTFMIPLDIYNDVVTNTIDVCNSLSMEIQEWDSDYVQLSYRNRTDAQKYVANGIDYATMSVYIDMVSYNKAVLGNESYIKIDGTTLSGVSNITYQSGHQQQGVVLGYNSPVQENRLSGVSKGLTIDMILCRDDDLHLDLMNNDSSNKEYVVEYYNGFVTRTMKMSVNALTEYVPMGNTIKAQLVLGIKTKGD